LRRQSPPPRYFWTVGGSSRIHGQTFIVLTLPPLFLITVIFIRILKLKKELGTPQFYFFAVGGSSRIQGHTFIVFTLPLLFFTTVIFMARSLSARGAPNVLRKWGEPAALPQGVDDHVDQPGTERAVLLRVLRLLALHVSLR
jgi:hypothetical protein